MYTYKTRGVCSTEILFDIKNDIITDLTIVGGCRGNTQGVAKLAIGRNVDEVISLLKGIKCRGNTSCPDQLATALELYKNKT
ncbi:MAG TPA: TIGR03905 family TSCPD domain-containing protein [Clostridia bacterium]|nr:TIGR03905 family TSCPD domain-containing protein [Clostridia bacterium]